MTSQLPISAIGAVLAAASSAFAPALAQDISQPPPPSVTPLVVTPTRIAEPLEETASSVTLITATDIEANQWRTLPEALADAPGLNVVQTGGPGGLTSIFIRGLNSNHTKVIIDGIEAEDPSVGAFDFGQGLTSGLARIEILRGPAASLYGADALGGVINIITAPGEGPARLSASVEGGSFDTLNETLRLAGSSGLVDYAFGFAHAFAGDTPVTPLGLLAPGEARIGDRYANATGWAKVDLQATPILGFGLVARYVLADLRSTGEDYDTFPAVPDAAQTDQYTRQLFTRAEARLSLLGGHFENVAGLAYVFYHTTIQGPDDGYGLPAPTIDDGDRLRADWQGTLTLSKLVSLVVGADVDRQRLIDSPIDAEDSDQGLFGELIAKPAVGLTLAASVRFDHDDRFGDVGTWRAAPSYTIAATGTVLRGSFGTAFRAPTLNELFVSYPSFDFFADPDLKPERSQGYDVGFEQPLARGALRAGATWFHNVVRDLIDDNADGTSYANIDRATTYGVESFIAWRASSRLNLRTDYTYTFTRDDLTGEELLRRPKDKIDMTAAWRATDRLKITATWLYVGGQVDGSRDFSIPRLWASPYATVNLAASYDLGHGVTLFVRADNLTNRHYEEPAGFEKPGVGVFGGVKLDLDAKRLTGGL
jgi:vitamin B12 transporter